MTASDPRVGEIQARSDEALIHESLNPSDYAELAWASARDVPYLLAELADRDEKLARVTNVLDGWAAEVPFEDAEDSQRWYSVGKRHAAERIRFEMAGRAAVAAANGGGE